MSATWLDHYAAKYQPFLDLRASGAKRGLKGTIYNRAQGFRMIFELLLRYRDRDFAIVETGSTRRPDNWKDGNSGMLFADFVRVQGGFVRSVDIDPRAVEAANQCLDPRYHHATCEDSVSWLGRQQDLASVDLFYLDSWDVDWQADQASAQHHLREFQTIESHLKAGCIVAIDDNAWLADGRRTGKGRLIVEYLADQKIKPLYDGYQIIFQWE